MHAEDVIKEKAHPHLASPKIAKPILGEEYSPDQDFQWVCTVRYTPSPKISSGILGEGREGGCVVDNFCMHTRAAPGEKNSSRGGPVPFEQSAGENADQA